MDEEKKCRNIIYGLFAVGSGWEKFFNCFPHEQPKASALKLNENGQIPGR